MNKTFIIIAIIIIVIVGALFYGMQNTTLAPLGEKGEGTTQTAFVRATDNGYEPESISVKAGTKITFTNESTELVWTASDVHPTHQLLPGFDALKGVPNGESYSYVFTKEGTWSYHNHLNPGHGGEVIVE